MRVGTLRGPEDGIRFPEAGVTAVVSQQIWVLGAKLRSSGREASAPDH